MGAGPSADHQAMASVPKLENFFPELFSGTERRSEPRMVVDKPARMKSLSPLMSTGPSIRARIVEVSHSGMTLRMNCEFQLGELVQVIVPESSVIATASVPSSRRGSS